MTKQQIKKAAALLRRVRDRILANPKKYDQDRWCGTECCIAGHIAVEAGAKLAKRHGLYYFKLDGNLMDDSNIQSFAERALGVTDTPWIFEYGSSGEYADHGLTIGSEEPAIATALKGAAAIEMYIAELESGEAE